ncbi:hypothetical protein [Mycobacterium neglectum]|uniref:hypothetical protein n=1 Tax=Mycobacterium neglectum TaxID=242737 RepID=UPI000BFECFC5|nr:hypothetical protein [Mycobacterium neglectum]
MCGDDPAAPDINKEDVSKDNDNELSDGITASDGQESLTAAGLKPRLLEAFGTRTFEDVWNEVKGIQTDAAPSRLDERWRSIGEQLHTSVLAFEREVKSLKESGDWEGKTIEAAFTNAVESVSEPFYTGTAALRGAELVHKFRDTLTYVYDNLVKDPLGEFDNMYQRYEHDRDNRRQPIESAPGQQSYYYEETTEAEKEAIRQYYNEYMRIVMNHSYKPNINAIYDNYPHFRDSTAAAEPVDIPGLPEKPGANNETGGNNTTTGGYNGSPFSGGGSTPNFGSASPSIPKSPGPSLPTGLGDQPNLPTTPADGTGPGQPTGPSPSDPSQATGAASGLANGLGKALGSATQAAKASPTGLPSNAGKKPSLPEGALQLGKGGASSGTAGKSGGGAGLGGLPKELSRLPGLAAAATQADGAGASRPAAGAGAGAMGPPGTPGGAGHGAGAAQGKEHKVNKALRSRQNGSEIAGEVDAVVPVIGEDHGQGAESGSPERRRPPAPLDRGHREEVVQRAGSEAEQRHRQQLVPPEGNR